MQAPLGRNTRHVATIAIALVLGGLAVHPTASAKGGCGWGKFSDERPPGACWRPFADESPFNRRLPAAPRQVSDSTRIAGTVAGWGPGLRFGVGNADTADDYNHPLYFSARSNPVYRVNCVSFGGQCEIDGKRLRIPNLARPAGGSDGHLAVIDQRDGWEYDLWQVADKPAGGGRIDVAWGGRTRIGTEDAMGLRAGGTAAGFALSAGVIRPAELRSGEIDHALFMTVSCTNGSSVFPAGDNSGAVCSSRSGAPAMGQHFYLEMSEGEIDALAAPAWQKTILRALARYGMFVGDTGGPGWGIKIESGSSFTSFGKPDPWVGVARHASLVPSPRNDGTVRYMFDMESTLDWGSELRVAAPCVSRGRC